MLNCCSTIELNSATPSPFTTDNEVTSDSTTLSPTSSIIETTPAPTTLPTPLPTDSAITTPAPVEGVNINPSEDALQFAQTHCQGNTYSTIVEITSPQSLVSVIQAISENNSDYWVSLTKTDCPYVHCRVLPWSTDSGPGGVLYLLPPGMDYVIEDYISDHGQDSSMKKRSVSQLNQRSYENEVKQALVLRDKRSHQSRVNAPRIGLCGLGEAPNSRSKVKVRLRGGSENTILDGNDGDAPITLVETQLELYNLTLDGSSTHSQQSSIIMYKARLIADNVAFLRSGSIMTTRGSSSAEASGNPGFVEYGLVYLDYSHLYFNNSNLEQKTDTGSMVNGFVSNMTFTGNTEITPYERTWIFYSYFSNLNVTNSALNAMGRNQSLPVFMDSHDEYKIQGDQRFCKDPGVQSVASQCSNCNPSDYCWINDYFLNFAIDSDYDNGFTDCYDIDFYCKNNNLEISNNRFNGDWEYLVHSYYDDFTMTDVVANEIDSPESPCIVDSVLFRGNLQVSHPKTGLVDCSISHPLPVAATTDSPERKKRASQAMGSRAVYNAFRTYRLASMSEINMETVSLPTPLPTNETVQNTTGTNYTSSTTEAPDQPTSSALPLAKASLPVVLMLLILPFL